MVRAIRFRNSCLANMSSLIPRVRLNLIFAVVVLSISFSTGETRRLRGTGVAVAVAVVRK